MPDRRADVLDEDLISRVVDRFYGLAREDEIVGPVFRRIVPDDRWKEHLATIGTFWSSVLLGSGRYEGRPMAKHLAIVELDDLHFERWLSLFRETACELCSPEIAAIFVERSLKIANAFRINIRMRRGEDLIHLRPLGGQP